MKNKREIKGSLSARGLRWLFTSRYGLITVAVALAAVGGAGYWYRDAITSANSSGYEAVMSTLGLGLAPLAGWVAVLIWALGWRRSWFRRANLWAASLFFVAFTFGFMAFFRDLQGPLATFTPDRDGSLGGSVGDTIIGSTDWVGALRLAALLLVGTAIVIPSLAMDLAAIFGKRFGQLVVFAWVFAVVGVKGLASALRSMYRSQPAPSPGTSRGAVSPPLPPLPTEPRSPKAVPEPDLGVMTPSAKVEPANEVAMAAAQPTSLVRTGAGETRIRRDVPRSEVRIVPLAEQSTLPAKLEPRVGSDLDVWEKTEAGPRPEVDGEGDPDDSALQPGKFNRFWAAQSGELEETGELLHDEVRAESDADEKAEDGLIIDSAKAWWDLPPIDLLVEAPEGGISEEEMAQTGETIKRTLDEYGVEVEIGQISPGPTVTMYGLIPGWVRRYKQVKVTDEDGQPKRDESGKPIVTRVETKTRVKVDSIMSREKDLSLALKTPSIRIETPVMGESLVGIEVPNPTPDLVTVRGVMESEVFEGLRAKAKLPIALGKGSGGETVVIDLATMPHLLIAGSTGSGKSVCINTIVSCLIAEKTPSEVRLLLVDPKRVELTPYNGIPHLLEPVVVETDQVVSLLKGLIREMLNRYRRMEEVGVRNIDSYNTKMFDKMPYLVVAVDELADLMMSASFDVEQSLCRLAQLGRATGIHLIVATQRPSVDVVTGLIKANFPSRISFGVTSQIDSRTILDTAGAEKLLGRGDMLYLAVDGSRPERVQGVFISDEEIEALVNFWNTTPWGPLPKVSLHTVGDGDAEDAESEDDRDKDSRDELLESAMDVANRYKKLSTSLLQRRLRIGYPRAARLMDQLEEEGVVGPSDGSKSRDVIMSNT